jgi:hypothetical protein
MLTPTASTGYGHTGVIGGWTYYYRVQAVTSTGVSPLSNEASVTVPTYSLQTPAITSVSYNGNGSNFIYWSQSYGPVEYKVYWGTSNGVTTGSNMLTPTTNTVYEHSGIQSGYTYCYRVTSANRYNQSSLSNEYCISIP